MFHIPDDVPLSLIPDDVPLSLIPDAVTMALQRMFVYGTLKRGQPNHKLFQSPENGVAKFLGTAKLAKRYPLVIASQYNIPYLLPLEDQGKVRTGSDRISGRVKSWQSYCYGVTVPHNDTILYVRGCIICDPGCIMYPTSLRVTLIMLTCDQSHYRAQSSHRFSAFVFKSTCTKPLVLYQPLKSQA